MNIPVDAEHVAYWRALAARDDRFDGVFFTAVRTTGIYCRPSCPSRTPQIQNVRFFILAAAAEDAGFRACRRCRPDAVPGSPQWNTRADLVARVVRLVDDGFLDRGSLPDLAAEVGYSVRQVQRLVTDELGAGISSLARSRRTHTARILLETTELAVTDIAFASGFGSVRSFNDAVRRSFSCTPGDLRRRRASAQVGEQSGGVSVRLAYRRPLHVDSLLGHLVATSIVGVDRWSKQRYWRSLDLPGGPGLVSLKPADGYIAADFWLTDHRDLRRAIARCRRLLDLDADPTTIAEHLADFPGLAAAVRDVPGRRLPGAVDGAEMAIRIVVGQQISTAAASTVLARLVRRWGSPLPRGLQTAGVTHLFPRPEVLAEAPVESVVTPARKAATVTRLASAIVRGEVNLGPGADRAAIREQLADLPGIGPWTVEMIALRAVGDPDAYPATDLGVRRGIAELGVKPEEVDSWAPWRSYATQYLWAASPHPSNQLPKDIP